MQMMKNHPLTRVYHSRLWVILCSQEMKPLWDVIKFDYAGEYYENVDELNKDIMNWIKDGDYIFVKSSHSIGLYKTITLLKNAMK